MARAAELGRSVFYVPGQGKTERVHPEMVRFLSSDSSRSQRHGEAGNLAAQDLGKAVSVLLVLLGSIMVIFGNNGMIAWLRK